MSEHASYDPQFFEKLAAVEDEHFWFCGRNLVIAALTRQVTDGLPSGYRVLEIGCGTGNVLRALEQTCAGGTVLGMDLFGEGLKFARERTHCGLVQGDLRKPPFGILFEVIGAFDVIEHLPDEQVILRGIHAMLRPRGVLLVTVPARKGLWSYFDEDAHHCRRYERNDLARVLNECGFEVEFLTEFMASIYPLVWLNRKLGALRRRVTNSEETDMSLTLRELRVIPIVNGALKFVLGQEAKRIEARRTLPFGTSLVAVARRA
jgi:SAM-dependent methyltransferase